MDTLGEIEAAELLTQRGYKLERAPEINSTHPDYAFELNGETVVFEVYEPTLKNKESGRRPLYQNIRKGFTGRKYKQAKAANEAGLPFVLAYYRTNFNLFFEEIEFVGAMLGDLTTTTTVGLRTVDSTSKEMFAGWNSQLQKTKHTSISAIAIPTKFNLSFIRLLKKVKTTHGSTLLPNKVWKDLLKEAEYCGEYDPSENLFRVTFFLNPYATIPFKVETFVNEYDTVWDVVSEDEYGISFQGSLLHNLHID